MRNRPRAPTTRGNIVFVFSIVLGAVFMPVVDALVGDTPARPGTSGRATGLPKQEYPLRRSISPVIADPATIDIRDPAFAEITVTVPAPKVAPTLINFSNLSTAGLLTAGEVYEVAYTYTAHNYDSPTTGVTLLSPVASFTAVEGQALAAMPHAPLGIMATGAQFYIRNVTRSESFRRARFFNVNQPAAFVEKMGFGDVGAWGGALIAPSADDPPPTTNTAIDLAGRPIPNPTRAPILTPIAGLPASTMFYAAYSYVGEDGTETALSPVSAGVKTPAAPAQGGQHGRMLYISIPEPPPSGAVFKNVYVGTSPTDLKLQQEHVPLSYVRPELHTYNPRGRTVIVGRPQSTISSLQRAIDWSHANNGGHKIIVPPAPGNPGFYQLKVPLILPYQPGPGRPQPVGIEIEGQGMRDSNSTSSKVRFVYTGALSGVEFIVSMFQSALVRNLDFHDRDNKVRYGLAMCDFHGGQSFTNHWENLGVQANGLGGIGFVVPVQSHSTGHSASEQYFKNVSFVGRDWGVELHSAQTTNIVFDGEATFGSLGGGPVDGSAKVANSGDLRSFGVYVRIKHGYSFVRGQYGFFLSSEHGHPHTGGNADLFIRDFYAESNNSPFLVYASPLDANGTRIYAEGIYLYNVEGRHPTEMAALYMGNRGAVQWNTSSSVDGWVFLDYRNPYGVSPDMEGPIFVRTGHDWVRGRFKSRVPSVSDEAMFVFGGIRIGNGATITQHLSATESWDPRSIGSGSNTSKTIRVRSAELGATVAVGFSQPVPAGALLVGAVTSADVVTVTLLNMTGAPLDLAPGTLRADVWRH